MPKIQVQHPGHNDESYTERMYKCSAAQWEERLASKCRDYHQKKLNNSKAGVVNTGSSRGFEGFSRRLPEIIRTTSDQNRSLLMKTTESRIKDLESSDLLSKSDSYIIASSSASDALSHMMIDRCCDCNVHTSPTTTQNFIKAATTTPHSPLVGRSR